MPDAAAAVPVPPVAFPLALQQNVSRGRTALPILLLPPAVATMLAPLMFAASAVPSLTAVADNPLAALQAGGGIIVWAAFFVLPVKRLLGSCRGARSVHIDGGVVTVREQSLLGCHTWHAPLQDFRGLAHCVRSTLSGVHHELHLVHPEGSKSLLIFAAERISPTTVACALALLGLPLVPPRRNTPSPAGALGASHRRLTSVSMPSGTAQALVGSRHGAARHTVGASARYPASVSGDVGGTVP